MADVIETDAGSFDAAVALLSGPDEAPAPSEPTPEAPAPAPTPAPTPETPPTGDPPVEAPPTPEPDPADKLFADLEARRQARAAKPPTVDPVVAQLQAQVAKLEGLLGAQQSGKPDLQALIAQHGEVEGLRQYGIDPLQFFDGFRKRAQQNNPQLSKAEQDAAAARAAAEALQKKYDDDRKADQEHQEAAAMSAKESNYLQLLKHPEAKFDVLHKMDADEQLEATYKTIRWLDQQQYDRSDMSDYQLALIVDRRERDRIRRLTGSDAPGASKTTTTVPTTDGAKTTPAAKAPVSLTNDLASQFTGGRKLEDLNDRESFAIAERILQSGAD